MRRICNMLTIYVLLRVSLVVNVGLFSLGILRFATLSRYSASQGAAGDTVSDSQLTDCSSSSSSSNNNNSQPTTSVVPNIVHYIWYNTEPKPFRFQHMLSVLSAQKILRPDVIYFHANIDPTGPYWERVLRLPSFKVNRRQPPTHLFGEKVKDPFFYTSHSNVDRVKVLMEYGGIYMDLDVLVIRPFHDLRRKFPCTIGREQETKACGSVIICSKDATFLLLWINSYLDDYRMEEWAYNSGQVPFNLARRFPHLVHMDEDRINRPNFEELELIWAPGRTWNWRRNYAVHLWYRLWKERSPYFHGVEPDDETVKSWNSTFGEMARSILYGSPDIIHREPLLVP